MNWNVKWIDILVSGKSQLDVHVKKNESSLLLINTK